jgi:hypothetical protein
MSLLHDACRWLHETPAATAIRESEVAFPVLQVIHVLGLVLMVGTVFIVDLRLLGLLFRSQPVLAFARQLLKLTWSGFWLLAASGSLLFAAQAGTIYTNTFLRLKFLLLILAGLNVIVFNRTTYRQIEVWGLVANPPQGAKVAAALSLLSWGAILSVSHFSPYFATR